MLQAALFIKVSGVCSLLHPLYVTQTEPQLSQQVPPAKQLASSRWEPEHHTSPWTMRSSALIRHHLKNFSCGTCFSRNQSPLRNQREPAVRQCDTQRTALSLSDTEQNDSLDGEAQRGQWQQHQSTPKQQKINEADQSKHGKESGHRYVQAKLQWKDFWLGKEQAFVQRFNYMHDASILMRVKGANRFHWNNDRKGKFPHLYSLDKTDGWVARAHILLFVDSFALYFQNQAIKDSSGCQASCEPHLPIPPILQCAF